MQLGDSDEEAIAIAHEQYIRLLEEAGREQPAAKGSKSQDLAADFEIQGRCRSQRRRPPHSKRRLSRHSKPLPKSHVDEEEIKIAHEEFIRFLEEAAREIQDKKSSTLNASDGDIMNSEAVILQKPANGSKSQDLATDLE